MVLSSWQSTSRVHPSVCRSEVSGAFFAGSQTRSEMSWVKSVK